MEIKPMVDIAVIWKPDTPNKTKSVVDIVTLGPNLTEESLKQKYPYPEFHVQVFWTNDPAGVGVEKGRVYPAAWDDMDIES